MHGWDPSVWGKTGESKANHLYSSTSAFCFWIGHFSRLLQFDVENQTEKMKSWTNLLFLCLVGSCCCSEQLFLKPQAVLNLVGEVFYKCTQFKSVGGEMTFSQSFIHSILMWDKNRLYIWEETDTSTDIQSLSTHGISSENNMLWKKWLSQLIMANRTNIWYKNWPDMKARWA